MITRLKLLAHLSAAMPVRHRPFGLHATQHWHRHALSLCLLVFKVSSYPLFFSECICANPASGKQCSCTAGTLTCKGKGYATLSAFSLAAVQMDAPSRRSSCGFHDVKYKGVRLSKLREQAAQQACDADGHEGSDEGNTKSNAAPST